MSVYRELDHMIGHRTQFAFKGKREHLATVNRPNIAHPGQQFKIVIPQGSANHVIEPDILKITFDLHLASTDKARTVVNNVGRILVKKVLMLGAKDIDVINNSYIYDACKDPNLSAKEHEEKLPLGFDFFKHLIYPYDFEEDLLVTIELNSAKVVILCMGDTNAICKISDIILEYDAIFDDPYAKNKRGV